MCSGIVVVVVNGYICSCIVIIHLLLRSKTIYYKCKNIFTTTCVTPPYILFSGVIRMLLLLHSIIPCLHTWIAIHLCGCVNSELRSIWCYVACIISMCFSIISRIHKLYHHQLFTVHQLGYYNLVSLIFGTTIPTSFNILTKCFTLVNYWLTFLFPQNLRWFEQGLICHGYSLPAIPPLTRL